MSNLDYIITQCMLIGMLVFLSLITVAIIYCGLTTKHNAFDSVRSPRGIR